MNASHTFHHHQRMLLTEGTESSHDGRHSYGRPFRLRGRERRHWKSKNIGRNFCHRFMASSRSSQSHSISLSLGRSRDPCLNRLHDADINPPLNQVYYKRRGDECFSNACIGPSDKNPSRARIVSSSFSHSHSVDFSRSRKTLLIYSCRMIQKTVKQGRSRRTAPQAYPLGYGEDAVRGENEAGGFFRHPAKGFGYHSSIPVPTHR